METQRTKRCKVECLGEQEIDVYDIEVEGNHNFFGNNILVHNSVYLTLNTMVKTYLPNRTKDETVNELCKWCVDIIEPMIAAEFKSMQDQFGWVPNYLRMNREVIAEKALWTGKKRYVCLVNDTEGIRHEEPKIKITGIEVVRSSTPDICREWLRKSLKLVLGDDESDIHKFVKDFRKEFMKASIQEIAFPRSANGLAKYKDSDNIYGLKTPVHTKGSLLYNHRLRQLNLTKKYPTIIEGEKIKFIYLKDPNPLGDKVIAFPGYLPKEFGLEPYLDKETMFQKSFIEPLSKLLEPMGWSTEERWTLE